MTKLQANLYIEEPQGGSFSLTLIDVDNETVGSFEVTRSQSNTANKSSGGSKGGRRGRAPPPGVQILSISCSFWEILAKSYVGAPPGELAPPPRGNPGSATD